MEPQIRIEQLGSCPLAVVRRRATVPELPKVIPDACGKVWNAVRAKQIPDAGRHVALYWDDVMNLEIGVELKSPFEDEDELVNSATPPGLVASAVHFGPYNRLAGVHQAIRQWCAANGHSLAGPSWEIYGHWIDAWNNDPSKIRTDIYYLLKPGA